MKTLKLKQRVYDRWWPWRIGTVVKVLKTRVHIRFASEVVTYDRAHFQFLEQV